MKTWEKMFLCFLVAMLVVSVSGCGLDVAQSGSGASSPVGEDPASGPADNSPVPLVTPGMSPVVVNFQGWSDEAKSAFFDLAVMQTITTLSETNGLDNVTMGMVLDSKIYIQDEEYTISTYITEILSGTVLPVTFLALPVGSCKTGKEPTREQLVFNAVHVALAALFGFTPGEIIIPNNINQLQVADAPFGSFPFQDGFMKWTDAIRVLGQCNKYRVVYYGGEGIGVEAVSREQEPEAKVTRAVIDVGGVAGFGFLVYMSNGTVLLFFGPAAQYVTAAP